MKSTIFLDTCSEVLDRIVFHLIQESPEHRSHNVPEHCMISDAEKYPRLAYRDLLNLSLTCKLMRRLLGPRLFGHVSTVRRYECCGPYNSSGLSFMDMASPNLSIEELETTSSYLTDRVRALLAKRSSISFNNYVECLEADTVFVALTPISHLFPKLRGLRLIEFQPAFRGASNDLIPNLEYLCASVADITHNPVLYNSLEFINRLDVFLDKPEAGTYTDFVSQLKNITDVNIYIPENVQAVEHIQFRTFIEAIPLSLVYLALRSDYVMADPQLKAFINLVNNVWVNLEHLKLPHQSLLAMRSVYDDMRPIAGLISRQRRTGLTLTLSRRYDRFKFNHGCVAWFAMITGTVCLRLDFELSPTLSWPRNCDTLQVLLSYLSLMCNYQGVILALMACIWSRSDEKLLSQFVEKEIQLMLVSSGTLTPILGSLRNLHLWSRLPLNDPDFMREQYYTISYGRPDLQEFFRQWRKFLDGGAFTTHDTLSFLSVGAEELMSKPGDFAVWDILTNTVGRSGGGSNISIEEVEFLTTLRSFGYKEGFLGHNKGLKKKLRKLLGR
ncbi:uncharacterized protein KQ657_003243 [Scheffersomyces spartinae]|uniref:F-box domain-containing protein n=1 Tax=Scheffersomyces spartinae TaxID=45513 RepID=A0A9P8AJI5_9ASCO|nr:uncharacterized protein KQ657_003243 [Scheffersomyces spartinae]KAG7195480.1 hypothetical protein KQ657_003243 [Scheffersomyces spartinae]